jgi:hypothetical protein
MSDLSPEVARATVDKALEYGAWKFTDENDANDPEKVAEAATKLVEVAKQASQNKSINEAVLEILHAAGAAPQSEETKQAYEAKFGPVSNGNGHAPTTDDQTALPGLEREPSETASAFGPPAISAADASSMAKASAPPLTPESQSPTPSEPADSPASAAGDIEDIFPGYDDMKVADIKKAILASAASGDLTVEEWDKIRNYEAGKEERKTILSLQPEFKAPEPEPAPAMAAVVDQFTANVEHSVTVSSPTLDDNVSAFYNGETVSRAQQAGLPIPPAPQSGQNPPTLPIDITTVSDQELSRTATAYHSLFAHTQWLQSQEEGRERAAEHLEREAHRDAYVHAFEMHKNAIPEDKRGPTAIDGARRMAEKDADHAGPVRTWRSRAVRHGIDARELKALASGFDKAVWRINEELERRARLVTTKAS